MAFNWTCPYCNHAQSVNEDRWYTNWFGIPRKDSKYGYTGFGLGVIEGLTKVFFPEASATVIFVIMAIVLLIRPAGLFGRRA